MSNVSLSDNAGNTISPVPENSHPVATQTALQLTNASADTDTMATVTSGKTYRFTSLKTGGFYFGWATPVTAANVRWVCPLYHSIIIKIDIPSNGAATRTLHYATDANNGIGYLVEVEQ